MNCRLCLIQSSAKENFISLFNNDEESNLIKFIAKYLHIEISHCDAFSTIICHDCAQHLNEFHEFFQNVEEQQLMLKNKPMNNKHPMEQMLLSDSEDILNNIDFNDELPLNDDKDLIKEEGESLDKLILDKENSDDSDDSDEDAPLKSILDKAKDKKKSIKQSTLKTLYSKKKEGKSKYSKRKNKKTEYGGVKKCSSEKKKIGKQLTNDEIKHREEEISKYLQLKCEICNEHMENFKDLKNHFQKEHKEKAYITCCGNRFSHQFQLWDHIQSHLNPDRFRCEICNKVSKSQYGLKLHTANMHIDRNEMKHACHLCDKKFPFLSVLNSHMIVHSDEPANHSCESCGKSFKTDHMLKMHIRNMHGEKAPFVCETCGKEYKFKQSFERHVAEHQGQLNEPTDQCEICGKWLRYNCLRKHMLSHENRTYKCEICSKNYKTKASLNSHIAYSHKMKGIHSCTFCDKTFKRLLRLKEHMALHTGQKDNICPHCSREFRSKANMYMHIKKIHVEEWTKTQQARFQGPTQQKDEINDNLTEKQLKIC